MNDIKFITKDPSLYQNSILSNFYNIQIDLQSDTLFQTLEDSYYSFIYFQLTKNRNNINKFVSDEKYNQYLQTATNKEYVFNQGDNFCIYSNILYVFGYYESQFSSVNDYFNKVSKSVKKCRTIGNGINLSGYTIALDLMIQQLNHLYYTFIVGDKDARQINFLQDKDLLVIQANLLHQIINLQYANSYMTRDDVINTYNANYRLKLILSIFSVVFSCGVIMTMIAISFTKLENFNLNLKNFLDTFEKSVNNYNDELMI